MSALEKAFKTDSKNFETAHQIGEGYRLLSWRGEEDYRSLAERAMTWFQKSIALNPYYPYSVVHYAMCLDWLGRHDDASVAFQKARGIDPNSYFVLALSGWHCVQVEDWAAAKPYFQQSLNLLGTNKNPIATYYLDLVGQKLQTQAAVQK
jgi:tetratricopeptide (TPR) repeat protein